MMACVSQAALQAMAFQQAYMLGGQNQSANLIGQRRAGDYEMEDDLRELLSDWDKNYLLDEAMK